MARSFRVGSSWCLALGVFLLAAGDMGDRARAETLPAAGGGVGVPLGAGEPDITAARALSGGLRLTRLEDLQGLPCNSGADAGTLSLAINPVNRAVALSCPRIGQFQLDVAVGGPGLVATPASDIDCGSGLGDCSNAYAGGGIVTLAAMHEPDVAAFIGWSGACAGADTTCLVTMDAARQVSALFVPTLAVTVGTFASSRVQSCAFNFCNYFDKFIDSRARVRVVDIDTGSIAGVCDADTTLVVQVSQFALPSSTTKTCQVPVMSGHHLRLEAEGSSVLGGTQTFSTWATGACAGSNNPTCTPAAAVTVHDEVRASFL